MGQYQLWYVHFVPAHQTGRPIAKAVSLLLYLLLSLNQRQQSHVNSSFIMYHVIMRSLPPSHGCHVMYQSSIPKVHSIHATWNYWIYIHRYLFVYFYHARAYHMHMQKIIQIAHQKNLMKVSKEFQAPEGAANCCQRAQCGIRASWAQCGIIRPPGTSGRPFSSILLLFFLVKMNVSTYWEPVTGKHSNFKGDHDICVHIPCVTFLHNLVLNDYGPQKMSVRMKRFIVINECIGHIIFRYRSVCKFP